MVINFRTITENATVPTRGSEDAAGWDLYAAETVNIKPGEVAKIPTDIAVAIPMGYFGGIYARSGLATRSGLRPANCVGIIDADYRGNVIVALYNDSPYTHRVLKGDRIAQLIVQPFMTFTFEEVDELLETNRGEGGFGSTGNN